MSESKWLGFDSKEDLIKSYEFTVELVNEKISASIKRTIFLETTRSNIMNKIDELREEQS